MKLTLTFQKCEKANTILLSKTNTRILSVNTYHEAGESRRHVQNVTKFAKNVHLLELHDHIWNHHEKCIEISTNMPGIGSLIREIDFNISEK